MEDSKTQDRLNFGDFQMLILMANGYLFENLNNGVLYARKPITKEIIEVELLNNQFDSDIDEQTSASAHKYKNLCLIKATLNKPTWNKFYPQIESLYDNQDFDNLWTLLAGCSTERTVKEGLFNDNACKNFIGTNSSEYLVLKRMALKSNVEVLKGETPYNVYINNVLTPVENNPYQRVVDAVAKTLDTMADRRMYNEIWINTQKGRQVDEDLYNKKESLKFWKHPEWWKSIKAEKTSQTRANRQKLAVKQKSTNDTKETGR